MNATRETVEPAMRAAAQDVCGEYMEIVPPDTRNLMGFYVSLRRLLVEVIDRFCAGTLHSLTDLSAASRISPSMTFSSLLTTALSRSFPTSSTLSDFASRGRPLLMSTSTRPRLQRRESRPFTTRTKTWNHGLTR